MNEKMNTYGKVISSLFVILLISFSISGSLWPFQSSPPINPETNREKIVALSDRVHKIENIKISERLERIEFQLSTIEERLQYITTITLSIAAGIIIFIFQQTMQFILTSKSRKDDSNAR